mgnify:CR=1 FL=1
MSNSLQKEHHMNLEFAAPPAIVNRTLTYY